MIDKIHIADMLNMALKDHDKSLSEDAKISAKEYITLAYTEYEMGHNTPVNMPNNYAI